LAALIDFVESHNRETRVSWENAIARGQALGIARSEPFPLLSAAVMSGVQRDQIPFGTQFYGQTVPAFRASLDLSYTIVDFGARRGRIDAERARLHTPKSAYCRIRARRKEYSTCLPRQV
jgi:outer membrane protein